MAKVNNPRKTWQYSKDFKVKAVKLSLQPGQPIRFEPVKSRFEPLTEEGWMKTYYAFPIDFGGGVPDSQPDMQGNPLEQIEAQEKH